MATLFHLLVFVFACTCISNDHKEVFQVAYETGKKCSDDSYLQAYLVMGYYTDSCMHVGVQEYIIVDDCINANVTYDLYSQEKCPKESYVQKLFSDYDKDCTEYQEYKKVDKKGFCVYQPVGYHIYIEFYTDSQCTKFKNKAYYNPSEKCMNYMSQGTSMKWHCLLDGSTSRLSNFTNEVCSGTPEQSFDIAFDDCVPIPNEMIRLLFPRKMRRHFRNDILYYVKMPEKCVNQ